LLSVAGRLISDGYGLPGLHVSAVFADPTVSARPHTNGRNGAADVTVAEGISGPDGRFELQPVDEEETRQQLLLLSEHPGNALALMVSTAGGRHLFTSEPLSVRQGSVDATLSIPLRTRDPSASLWKTLAARVHDAGIQRVNELAKALAAGSSFEDWSIETRHAMLLSIEQAFLDPRGTFRAVGATVGFDALRAPGAIEQLAHQLGGKGLGRRELAEHAELASKLDTFTDLRSVDWVLYSEPLKFGDASGAIYAYVDAYRDIGKVILEPNGVYKAPPSSPDDDLVSYRNYLRAIWVAIATKSDGLNKTAAVVQLYRRFHQDFRTTSTEPRPANELAAAIVTEALVAPKGPDYGFKVAPASIEARGSRTAREYLDYLIGRTKLSAHELGRRYRLNLERPDGVLSSEVEENVATLQGFFRDSFQSEPDPFPIIPDEFPWEGEFVDRAPFFLEYEEWLRSRRPFYGENFHSTMKSITGLSSAGRDLQRAFLKGDPDPNAAWMLKAFDLDAKVASAIAACHQRRYIEARAAFIEAAKGATELLTSPDFTAAAVRISEVVEATPAPLVIVDSVSPPATLAAFNARRALTARNATELAELSAYFDLKPSVVGQLDRVQRGVMHFVAYTLPVSLGDLAKLTGDYAGAIDWYSLALPDAGTVGMADESSGPYVEVGAAGGRTNPRLHIFGDLPYTFRVAQPPSPSESLDFGDVNRANTLRAILHDVELKCVRLRLGEAMLTWADSLYRRDDASSLARARELYKAVLMLHKRDPGVSPDWEPAGLTYAFTHHAENPALASQLSRARLGLAQLEAGLNYFGFSHDLVPVLRYGPLKAAADGFATLAGSVAAEFLEAMDQLEKLTRESVTTKALLRRASLQGEIAAEQTEIAAYQVSQATEQKAKVLQTIEDKRKEIEDHDSFWSQLEDAVSGFADALSPLSSEVKSGVAEGFAAELGGDAAADAGLLGLGAGASMTAGFGLFAYASYMSISGMTDAANQRRHDLATLESKTLPAAQAAIDVKQRQVAINALQGRIAESDAQLALDLTAFDTGRFLNAELWINFASVMQRILRRYLELAARTGWLAERALAYEQDRSLSVMGLDYFPVVLQGMTGVDVLKADLAELEASRLAAMRERVPVKHTFSVARDFMLEFGRLKRTGRCVIHTTEQALRRAYPGTYGHRIRAASVTVVGTAVTSPARGALLNAGVSLLSRADGTTHPLVRPADALPISEFRLHDDMAVHGLPDETLLPFEGSGADTFWELELPASGNPYGLGDLGDVLLTLDLEASFSSALHAADIAAMPASLRRMAILSAARHDPKGLEALRAGSGDAIAFDVPRIGLGGSETNRRIANLVVFLVGDDLAAKLTASLRATGAAKASFPLENSVAFSNAPPLVSADFPAKPASPLNAFVGKSVDRVFQFAIGSAENPGLDLGGLRDVVLGMEYTADITT
jgi:hypothetical protein